MLNATHTDVYTDFSGLAKLKNEARKESPEALKAAAKQFEGIFLNNVLKSMREAKLSDGIMDNDQSKFYSEMYDQQLATQLSGSVGLADLIVKQMKHDKPDNGKLELEDYLNRSSALPKVGAGSDRSADARPVGKANLGLDKVSDEKPDLQNNQDKLSAVFHMLLMQGKAIDSNADFEIDDGASKTSLVNEVAATPLKNEHALPIQSAQDFVKQLHPLAEQAAKELGVEPKVLLAQAALETNWGRSLIKNSDGANSFNLFNIKADKTWQGRQAQVKTLEFDQGIGKKVSAGFRSYTSFEESFHDYVDFIKNNPRYGDALKQVGNAKQYMRELQQAGYATDPKYADKVMQIYHGNTMSEFKPDIELAINNQTG